MNTARAAAAGLIGTATMTALLLIEPSIGLPDIAMGQILGGSLGLASALPNVGAAVGWLLHFVIGAAFAVVYAATLARRLPGAPLLKGMCFGLILFVLAQVAFMPFVGGGFFSRGDPQLLAGSLLGHFVYGGVMAWIYAGAPAAA